MHSPYQFDDFWQKFRGNLGETKEKHIARWKTNRENKIKNQVSISLYFYAFF